MEAHEQMIQILELSKKSIKMTNTNMLLIIKEKIEKFDEKMKILCQELKYIKYQEGS